LDIDVYLLPTKDIKKEGYIWRLKKPFYGLNYASQKFCLSVNKLFAELGLPILKGDEAMFCRKTEFGKVEGMISTCVDDFDIAGEPSFVDMITKKVSEVLDVSKLEDDKFRYTEIDIEKVAD